MNRISMLLSHLPYDFRAVHLGSLLLLSGRRTHRDDGPSEFIPVEE